MHRTNVRPSAALIVAVIALVAAVAGTATALPGKNKVDKNDIIKGAVRAKAIKDGIVSGAKLADGSVGTTKLADGAVASAKLGDGAVSAEKLADASVGRDKIAADAISSDKIAADAITSDDVAADAIDSANVAADSLTGDDLAPGVLSVVAYGRVINNDPGVPVLAPGSVGLEGVVVDGADGDGRTDVTVKSSALGTATNLDRCTIQATSAVAPTSNASLGFASVTLAIGSVVAGPRVIQAQTRDENGGLADSNYFVQVTCPNV